MKAFMPPRRGATSIEYGLIATIVSVAIIFGVLALSGSLDNLFSQVANEVGVALP